jgi:hypothetical protein
MNNIVIKSLNEITPFEVDPTLSKSKKTQILTRHINTSKYTVHGFVDRTNCAILEARYHNVRDRKGRFARVKQSR